MKHESNTNLPFLMQDSPVPHSDMPFWDATLRRLYFRGECIKAFTGPAENQEAILFAFQLSTWMLIDNPLPPDPQANRYRQLEYAVRRLNSHQHPQQRLRFHVCDYGKKIYWEAIDAKRSARKRRSAKKMRHKTK
jgi:hypothetical protein